jgi:AAHS family 4-hydroxybenzoate transporter-like MFS transporter
VDFLLARQPANALARANSYLRQQALPELARLPEPGKKDVASPVSRLISKDLRLGTLYIWGAFFASFFTLYFLTSWIPSIGVGAGFELSTAIQGSAVFSIGAFFGLVTLGWFTMRMPLARVIGWFFLLSFITMIIFGAVHTPVFVFYSVLLVMGFLIQGGFGGLYAVATRFYPITARSTGVGWAIGIGRFGAIAGPLVGGFIINSGTSVLVTFSLFAFPMLIAALMTWLVAGLQSR